MLEVIERAEGRYDAREVEFGTVYRRCPEGVVAESVTAVRDQSSPCL